MLVKVRSWTWAQTIGGVRGTDLNSLSHYLGHQVATEG